MTSRSRKVLWIGGSSQLARTYYNTYCNNNNNSNGQDELFLSGYEGSCPFPLPASENSSTNKVSYYPLDLTQLTDRAAIPEDMVESVLKQGITSVVISIRPVLMTAMNNDEARIYNQKILDGLEILLQAVIYDSKESITSVIHISSVAAVDHLKPQVNHCEEDDDDVVCHTTTPAMQACNGQHSNSNNATIMAPYDKFKLDTESVIALICNGKNDKKVLHTNLRVSGLLFEEGRCIVGQSFELQARLGVYIPTKVDMNPARNVCAAIRLLRTRMEELQDHPQREASSSANAVSFPVRYYYTRPTHTRRSISMYELTYQYQMVNKLQWYTCLFTPWCVYVGFIYLLSQLALVLGSVLPYVHATSYLLRVSLIEHSFDNKRFIQDFPDICQQEITVQECFENRRSYLTITKQH